MCGLVGIAGNLGYKDEATMKRLLVLDYFRGVDSTGFASIREDGSVKIAKGTVNPIDLFDMGKFKDALAGYPSKVFMGHNRAATKGAVNNVNAHPFQFGDIVGAHNGTLDTSAHQCLENLMHEKDSLDSRLLIKSIDVYGIKEVIPKISGAWSLVWYDKSDDSINFLRNNERPMWYAFLDDFERLIWASEFPMIRAAIELAAEKDRYTLYSEKQGDREVGYFMTEPDVHYKWKLTDLKKGEGGTKPPKPLVKKIEGKAKTPVISHMGGVVNPMAPFQGGMYDPMDDDIPFTNTPMRNTKTNSAGIDDTELAHHIVTKDDPFAGRITRERFDELAKDGCGWCQADIEWGDPVTIFDRNDALLCYDCSTSRQDNQSKLYLEIGSGVNDNIILLNSEVVE